MDKEHDGTYSKYILRNNAQAKSLFHLLDQLKILPRKSNHLAIKLPPSEDGPNVGNGPARLATAAQFMWV